ncbi:MAG: CBS domain-containing protein [Epulopiscium sp.]|nr:CBS domain-containing protein [Candidatus Epulonipiscium sp.]
MLAKDIMEKKVISVDGNMLVEEVAKILVKNKISGVPVIDEKKQVIGIVTEADLLSKEKEPRFPSYIEFLGSIIYIEGVQQYEEDLRKLVASKAKEIMTTPAYTVEENATIEEVAALMVEKRINRVPVVNINSELVGIISRADMLKPLLNQ